MKHRFTLTMGLVVAAASSLLTVSCGDSGSPTEPNVSAPPTATPVATANVEGTWTGTFAASCSAVANFIQHGYSVGGALQTGEPCRLVFDFQGTVQGNALVGTFTDYDTYLLGANGTVSGADLEITLTDSVGTVFARLLLHR